MAHETVTASKEDGLGLLTLNRPEALNALNSKMVGEVISVLREFEEDDGVRCVVLSGNGRAFCAGADIKEMSSSTMVDIIKRSQLLSLWKAVGGFPKPVVAAVRGYALGGGLELAMACDILIAAEGTKLGQPEINIGIIPGGGGTQRLARAVGRHKAMEMILTGDPITAEQALQFGLVNRVVPPERLAEEARLVAAAIASKPPVAVRLAKLAVNKASEVGLAQGIEFERQLFYELFSTEDREEGMKAFLEKRKPEFEGR